MDDGKTKCGIRSTDWRARRKRYCVRKKSLKGMAGGCSEDDGLRDGTIVWRKGYSGGVRYSGWAGRPAGTVCPGSRSAIKKAFL